MDRLLDCDTMRPVFNVTGDSGVALISGRGEQAPDENVVNDQAAGPVQKATAGHERPVRASEGTA